MWREHVDERGRGVGRATVVYQGEGRKRRARTSADGTFDFTSRSPALRIWAERKDGALTARSSPVTLDISEGGEWEVDLVLESTRRAGLGIRVSRHDDGIYVRSVLPGSPAEGLGLMRGDIVIEVDGESVAGLSVSTITNRLTGPEGTQQAFTVRHLDGSVEELQFERRSITPSE